MGEYRDSPKIPKVVIDCLNISGTNLDGLLHHGVLAHEDITVSAHTATDFLELLGGDVISIADEDFVVCLEHTRSLFEVVGLPYLSIT